MPHAALALAATLILGAGPHQKDTRVLDPVKLRPVPGSPAFPRSTSQIDTSPDGTEFAVGFQRGLKVYGADGAELAHLRVNTGSRVISWLTADRIAIVKRGKPTTVRIVSLAAGKVIHREVLRARLSDSARVDERQVTLNAVKDGDEQTLSVWGADGVLERTIALPGMHDGQLRGRPVGGQALVLSGDAAFYDAVDLDTGTVTRHDLDLPEGSGRWIEPQTGDTLAIGGFGSLFLLGAGDTATEVKGVAQVKGAGSGFLSFDNEGGAALKVLDATGKTLWRVPKVSALDAAAFGDRVYTGSGYGDVHIREYDLATGQLLKTLPGRAYLFEPSAGRVLPPFFTSGAINED
ncbi:MAG: hypothetical protein QOF76_2570 [Solirubrobacteraceae bacterium]|jgi:hypothetical protein|nr:hypothetical protein [Solirubrobacteraceae bacterium]